MFRKPATLVLLSILGATTAAADRVTEAKRESATAACDRADAARKQRQHGAALEAAAECEREARPIAAHDLVARALIVRGDVAFSRDGALLDSIASFKAALAEAESSGDRALISRAYCKLVGPTSDLGDYPASLDATLRCYETNPKPDARARMRFLSDQGWAYMEIHERDAALRDMQEALELARRAGEDELVGEFTMNLGLAYARLDDDREKAVAYYDQSLANARRRKDKALLITVLNNSANQFRYPGLWDEAERRYVEALALAGRRGPRSAYPLKNIGIVYRETGRPKLAERVLLEALALADRQSLARIQWQARKELGTLFRESDPARAARYFEECLDALEARNTNVLLEGFSAGAIAGALTIQDDPYDLYIDLLLRQGQDAKALAVAERARARAFLDTLTRAREAIAGGLSPAYVQAERQLLKRISDNQSQLRTGGLAPEREAEVTATVRQAEAQLEEARVRLATAHPEIAHARYPHLLSTAEIQARLLGPDEALLEYFVGAEATTVWVVRRGGLTTTRLARRAQLETAVRGYLDALATPGAAYEKPGQALARMVLPSLSGLAGARRLVIVPHGALNYIPFETLPDQDGRFLIESHAVSYAPSAASLAYLRARPQLAEGDVVAIGNPELRAPGAADERGTSIERLGLLKPLPFTGRELQSVAAAYPGVTRVLDKQRATEPGLAAAGTERAAILHFATHGLIDEDAPDRSGLALTLSPGSDGILQTREIYGLHLRAALVTLSACQTALGKQITGEGILGLSRAFFYAGARAVMASLWNVNDASTAEFMDRFYAALRRGEPPDAAARTAKLAFIADARLRHPYFWAPFVVSGDAGASVRVTPSPRPLGPIVALALAAAFPVGVFWLRRRIVPAFR